MTIGLIIPPSPFLGDQKRNTPLGILYIASWLERHGHTVQVADLRDISGEFWSHKIKHADLYGITATTPEYPYAISIAKLIKFHLKASIIVLGGVHATADPENIDPIFDKVVMGEGELSILEVIKDIRYGTQKRIYPCLKRIDNLDSLPFPARWLLPRESFVSLTSTIKGEASTAIIGSRGCAYNCSFCASKIMWERRVRFRSPDNIVAEIKQLIGYGINHFRFQDDTLGLSHKWIMELCEKIKPLGVTWRGTTRVDHSEYDILKAMKDAGCYEIGYGIETLGDTILEFNNKGITEKEIKTAILTTHEIGLKTRLFFMIGLPGQDINIADNIIKFLEEVKPTAVNLSTFVPLPGSDIYNSPDKYGVTILTKNWSEYVMSKGLYGTEVEDDFIFKHDILTNEQLKALRKQLLEYFEKHNLIYNR